MSSLKLCFPTSILNQHLIVLGKTGAGKSSALRHIVEHLLDAQKRVCIVDPKGDWWGLKTSADGKTPGFPVVTFGDFKNPKASDVPINAQSGKAIAELVVSGNRPCVIGFRGWMPGNRTKFWIDFASTLFAQNTGELYLVGDEFHNFAPKGKVLSPEAGLSLHWSNTLLAEGRGLGIVCLLASQRPQKVHNDTLTSCETLVAMRVIHKADRDAVKDWIDGCGDPALGNEVLTSLAQMARGAAFVWSPEIGFGPKRITFPLFTTFDSFAPPQLQKKVLSSGWADVDLAAVKTKLAQVIEEAQANDPKLLRDKIAKLERDLKAAQAQKPQAITETKTVEIFVLPKGLNAEVAALKTEIENVASHLNGRVDNLLTILKKFNESPSAMQRLVVPTAPGRIATIDRKALFKDVPTALNGALPVGERAILERLLQFPDGLRREQLMVLASYKNRTNNAYIQRLCEKGLAEIRGNLVLATGAGRAALPNVTSLPTGKELQDYWRAQLPLGERTLFESVLAAYPDDVSRESLSEQSGYKDRTRNAYIQRMKSKAILIETSLGFVRASDTLFD